jgi:quercetin dioxygenase-like cupin family protein
MEAVFEPGMYTAVHRHAGPEAWHLVTGAQCLQTPDTTFVVPAGRSAVVPAGPPMRLSGVSAETRRALVLVLHEPAEPWMTLDTGWVPRTTC